MNNYIISKFLHAHPAPWRFDYDGRNQILDNTGSLVDGSIKQIFAEFVVALVNHRHANRETAEVVAGEIEAKFEELRRERDSANESINNLIDAYNGLTNTRNTLEEQLAIAGAEKESMRDEMAELHTIISAQRALIDGLQRRLDRLEERA